MTRGSETLTVTPSLTAIVSPSPGIAASQVSFADQSPLTEAVRSAPDAQAAIAMTNVKVLVTSLMLMFLSNATEPCLAMNEHSLRGKDTGRVGGFLVPLGSASPS